METKKEAEIKESYKYWRKRIFLNIWITYACFYLVRVNMSIAIPGIMHEFGISKTAMGFVLSSLFFVYAAGQFINGQFGDKFGARKLISVGLIVSALINLVFSFTNGILSAMMLLWGLNGYFQSMGWSPSVKTVANWFPPKRRAKFSSLLGTSYQIGNAVSWALSGFIVGLLGWRFAFIIPAAVCLFIGIHWAIRGRNAPEEVGLPTIEEENGKINEKAANIEIKIAIKKDHHIGFRQTLKMCFFNRAIWTVAFGLFFLNIVRYGFLSWAPTYMFEVQKAAISIAAYKAMALPIAGSLGALFAGWASYKFFRNRKAPVSAIMLFMLGISAWLYLKIPAEDWILSLICLMFIGFMTYGPHVMMVTSMPMDFGTRKAAASAAGFIDGWGYVGAALTGVASGWLVDTFSWNAAFYFWILCAFMAGILMLTLWKYQPKKGEYC
ncbi:MFS transporter [Patescibacteria group bacterium]|nr:MFS transporter [Patescibacteria group bacterium]MCG2700245.1 MFS transporter [Candidatus Parcubacteria bacterium]